jgi:hypothetical protein
MRCQRDVPRMGHTCPHRPVTVAIAAAVMKSATNHGANWEGYNCSQAYQDVHVSV